MNDPMRSAEDGRASIWHDQILDGFERETRWYGNESARARLQHERDESTDAHRSDDGMRPSVASKTIHGFTAGFWGRSKECSIN